MPSSSGKVPFTTFGSLQSLCLHPLGHSTRVQVFVLGIRFSVLVESRQRPWRRYVLIHADVGCRAPFHTLQSSQSLYYCYRNHSLPLVCRFRAWSSRHGGSRHGGWSSRGDQHQRELLPTPRRSANTQHPPSLIVMEPFSTPTFPYLPVFCLYCALYSTAYCHDWSHHQVTSPHHKCSFYNQFQR